MTCISYKFDWFKKIEPNDDTSITTTQIYTNVSTDILKENYELYKRRD